MPGMTEERPLRAAQSGQDDSRRAPHPPHLGGAVPFAGYKDFAACVAANGDKSDPKGYCANIMRQVEKGVTPIAKVDEDQRLVFGWFSMANVVDKEDDVIAPDVLEKAAYDYVLNFRAANERHGAAVKGQLVESFVVTPDKLEVMGLAKDAVPTGWWGGFKLEPDAFQKVKSGEYQAFSIEGSAKRVEV